MKKENMAAEVGPAEPEKAQRRPYVAPAVTDFFQPVVALGSTAVDVLCAGSKSRPPKR